MFFQDFAFTLPLSTQVYKCVSANKLDAADIMGDRLESHGGGSRNTPNKVLNVAENDISPERVV